MKEEPITAKMLEDAIKKVSEEPSEYREGYCNGYRIATNDFYYLIGDLEKENKELKEQVEYFKDSYVSLQNGSDEYEEKLLKENKELKENWNKLKEYLNKMIEHSSKYRIYDSNNKIDDMLKYIIQERKFILDKMQELEGDK